MQGFFSSKPNQLLGSIALFMLIVALGAYAYLTFKQSNYIWMGPVTISVTGEGEVMAIPDIGEFSFSVEASADTATAAQTASAESINAIMEYLEGAGVEEKDISTQYYNLSPRYRFESQVCPMDAYCPPMNQVADGYTVNQTIAVKVRQLDTAGTLMTGVGERGATNLSGLSFTVDDTSKYEDQARALAITDAQEKAVELARSLGVSLERMTGYYEEMGGMPMPYGMGGDMMMAEAKSTASVPPDIPVGEQTTVKRVTITYQVK